MRHALALLFTAVCFASTFPACASSEPDEHEHELSKDDEGTSEDDLRQNLYRGSSLPPKTLVYTVDDGPNDGAGPSGSGENTRHIAEYLASEGIPATFFVLGRQLTRTSSLKSYLGSKPPVTAQMGKLLDDIRTMPVAGASVSHLIANHTFTHGDPMTALSAATRKSEMLESAALIEPYLTDSIRLLRTPYGSWSSSVYNELASTTGSAKVVGNIFWNAGGALDCTYDGTSWSCPSGAADWACWKPGKGRPAVPVEVCGQGYLNEIEGRAGGKGIILTHDIDVRSLELAKWLVPKLKAKGYTFVRLDQVPEINKDLLAAGAKPAKAVGSAPSSGGSSSTTSAPASPPPCREGGVYCGGVYKFGGEQGSLYKCVNGRLSIAYQCQSECTKAPAGVPDSCVRLEDSGP